MTTRHGSCLCGAIQFSVAGNIKGVGCCHCSKCRKVSGTNGNAIFLTLKDNFDWLKEGATLKFNFESGWGVLRCATCGSPLPESHDGQQYWVPAGLMVEPLDTDIKQHIFCASRADWDAESPNARSFDEFPP